MTGPMAADGVLHQVKQWPFLVIVAMSVLLALVIPPSWIQSIPGVRSVLQAIADGVPAIQAYVKRSKFPEVAAVYFPAMLLLSPLHFIWIWRLMRRNLWDSRFATRPVRTGLALLVTLVLTLFLGFVTYAAGGGQLSSIPLNDSKIALALAGYLVSGGAFFVALASLVKGCMAVVQRISAGGSS